MAWSRPDYITLGDLYVAYRKAKVDMFYERDHVTAEDFCNFEDRLTENLGDLLNELNATRPTWMQRADFIGGYTYIPKSIDFSDSHWHFQSQSCFVASDPDVAWRWHCTREKPTAKFRIVGRHPVAFHIVSALWIHKVGHHYDALLKECAYASRLRRTRGRKSGFHPPSATSLGSFKPYGFGFRNWRANGLNAMRNALKQDRPIVAITADLRSFYHEVSAEYLLAPGFLDYLRPGLNKDDLLFTVQLVQALRTWAASTPEHKEEPDRGLPVGLSASRVIANVILCEFDRFILCELAPLYYGRYVDDVFLVLDNRCGMESSEAVWGLMIERSNGLLRRGADNGAIAYWLDLEYSPNSRLRFVGDKQKIFLLTGNSGQLLVESINRTVLKRSSDWRLLPDLPVDADELAADFLATGRDTTEEVDNLRKADGISVQRLAFAIRLRNFEAVQRDLRPEQWMSHRDRFFRLVLDYIVTPTGIFAYGPYIARLVGLAAACGDWENAAAVVKRLAEVFRLVGETAEANANQLESSRESLLRASFESAAKALSTEDAQGTGLNKLLTAFQCYRPV